MYPTDLRYSKDHEWVRVDGDLGIVGITDFAQGQLGDIVYIELPEIGKSVSRGEVLGTIESVKAVSEIYAPVSGIVAEVNEELRDRPETVNRDPHGAAWICKLRLGDASEVGQLMAAADYEPLTH